MTRSSKHKSHRQSKRSSKQSSDSEEDVKMKKSSKDENLARVHKESVSGEKRKISSQVQEMKDSKDLSGPYVSVEKRKISSLVQESKHSKELSGPVVSGEKRKISSLVQEIKDSKDLSSRANGETSKRRKEKADPAFGGDRWNGGREERAGIDRNVEKELSQRGNSKIDSVLKEDCSKDESLRIESKKKSRRHGSGSSGEKNDEDLASLVLDKEESKIKVALKKKAERDSSGRKEVKEPKHKDRRSDNEMIVGEESVSMDMDIGKKQASDFGEERRGKRDQDNTEHVGQDELRNSGLEKENKKKTSNSRREGFSEREMRIDDSKPGEGKGFSSRDRVNDLKIRDEKGRDGSFADKYPENGQKSEKSLEEAYKDNKHQKDGQRDVRSRDDGQMNEKYSEEVGKDNKHSLSKYGEDGEKDPKRKEDGDRMDKRRDEKHREDGERERRRKDEKNREGTEREHKDDKYREGTEREHKDDKYLEDGSMESRRRNDQYREDGDKDIRRGEDRYYEDGGRDDRRRDSSYRKEGVRDNRQKDGKYREDIDQDTRHKDMLSVDDVDRDKRPRDSKSRDEHIVFPSVEQSDTKSTRDDGCAADHHSRKSKGHGESPVRDDRPASYQDDHDRRRSNEKENYSDLRSRSTKDQKSYGDKRGANSGRSDPLPDKGRSTSRNAETERRQSSPSLNSHAARDHYRGPKQDEPKYRDYSYEGRVRHNTRDSGGRFDQISSSRSLEKLDQKVDGRLGVLSTERRLDSDIRSSSTLLMDKSLPLNTDRRRFGRSESIRSNDIERSVHRSGGSRDVKEYSSKERGSREDLLGDDRPQADVSNFSAPSPFARNNSFTSGSKSIPHPPPYSPNSRFRRNVDSNMGRSQGNNNWRGGIPSWPSPGPGGFLPFPPHGTPGPGGFLPFHVPSPMMSPFTLPRFPGGPHMGWHNPMDVPFNGVFMDTYPRPDWNQMSSGRGSDMSGDIWKGPNRSASVEIASSEKGNNSTQSPNESRSIQTPADQQAESTYTSQSDIEALPITTTTFQESSDIANMSKKDDVHHSYVYFSKLDISSDLSDPGLFSECKGLMSPLVRDDYKILYVKEAVECPAKILSCTLFPSADESVFQKAMSLYNKRMDRKLEDKVGEELNVFPGNSDQNVEDNDYENVNLKFDMEVEDSPPPSDKETTDQQTDEPEEIREEPSENVVMGLEEYDPVSDTYLATASGANDVECVEVNASVEESVLVNLSRIHDSPESTH